MSNMNSFARGRITGMPGTETTVKLYPQRLGVRMRNSIIRMLESRLIEGGWSSKSRQIAHSLAVKYGLQASTNHWNGLRIIGITEGAAPLVAEVALADWTAWILESPEIRSGYYRTQHDNAMVSIKNLNNDFWVSLHDKQSVCKVRDILVEHNSQEMRNKAKQVADMLRGTEPIEIITFQE
jgi:hypothetical protein